tara:strand:- start:8355 stop:9134 length:780 start_codon:yes stop_codon:yes gene_type:complete
MFYLSHFFQIVKRFPVRFTVFIVLTMGLFFSASHRDFIKNTVGSDKLTQGFHPYFHALISTRQNISWISRKLRELPGVERVEVLSKEKLNQQVQSLLSGMDGEIAQAVGEMELAGVKVVTRSELEERSITLIKEYLTRLSGTDTTVGATVFPPKKKTATGFVWQAWISEIIVATIFFLWAASVMSFITPVRKSSYLVEQFQRRRGVAMKTWGAAATIAIVFGAASAFVVKKPDIVPMVICFAVAMLSTFFYARRTSWEG